MRNFIKIVESSEQVDRAIQAEIEKIIEDGLENHSGCDHGAASNAAYDILLYGKEITPELIHEIVKNVGSYDPWEGFEPHSVSGVANEIAEKLGLTNG